MQGVAVGFLRDLFAATEAIGDDEPVGGGLANGGQEFEFSNGFGNVVGGFFEAEGSGHATASGSGSGEVDTHALQDGLFGGHLHQSFVVAVSVDERFAGYGGQGEIGRTLLEILHRGRLTPLPEGFALMTPTRWAPVLRSPLFSISGIARMLAERFVPPRGGDGEDIGITANSFNSVSLDPPMVLWSLSRKARSLQAFLDYPHFHKAVNKKALRPYMNGMERIAPRA